MSDPTMGGNIEHPCPNRGVALSWIAFLAGPVAWTLGFNLDYALVRVACAKGTMLPLHLVTVGALALAIGGGLLAHREKIRAGEQPVEAGGTLPRAHFMAHVGVWSCAFFALVIVAQWAAKLFIDPCAGI